MEKIVGNIGLKFIVGLVTVSCLHAGGIALRITDISGKPVEEIVLGAPFKIEISASDRFQNLRIEGLDKIAVQAQQNHTQIINGSMRVKYILQAVAHTLGSYTFGPATATVSGKQEVSDVVTIKVVAEVKDSSNGSIKPFARLTADTHSVMRGQKIACYVRFYFHDREGIEFSSFFKPTITDAHVSDFSEAITGKQTIDGEHYSYIEIHFTIVPEKVGSFIVPAFAAEYTKEEQDPFWGGFGAILGHSSVRDRVYSNALTIMVEDLPPTDQPVHAVGKFSDITLRSDAHIVKQGEGVVVALDCVGEGNFDSCDQLELSLPEALKAYASKTQVADHNSTTKRYSHEFIVQSMEPGDWEIPAQTFRYFDTATKKYCTLQSNPLVIHVAAQKGFKNNKNSTTKEFDPVHRVDSANDYQDDLAPLCEQGPWESKHEQSSFGMIFFAIQSMIFFGVFAILVQRYRIQRSKGSVEKFRRKNAFSHAYSMLQDIERRKAYHQIYALFIDVIVARSNCSIPEYSDAKCIEILQQAGFSQDDIHSWQKFFSDAAAAAYAGNYQQKNIESDLFVRAWMWLDRLKKVL